MFKMKKLYMRGNDLFGMKFDHMVVEHSISSDRRKLYYIQSPNGCDPGCMALAFSDGCWHPKNVQRVVVE